MPYQPVSIPYRGLNIDSGYSALPAGFTSQCLNVLPYDTFKGKMRIGQRRPLLGAFEVNQESPTVINRKVQAIIRADAYVSGALKQRCIIVAGGEVFIIDPGSTTPTLVGRGALNAMTSTGHIGAAVFGQYCYFADGTFYRKIDITASSPTVLDWSGPYSTVRTGTNPNFKYANLLCRFGGRLALSGLVDAPNNWFLCELNQPDSWNSTGSAHHSVSGASSTRFGTPGEPIVSLIPVGESGLMFACTRSLTYLTADPVLNDARLIELSRSVGAISVNAWCNSDSQTVYMMSQDGMYRVVPNEFQVTKAGRVTANRLDSFFQSQGLTNVDCALGYDSETQNIYAFLSRTDIPDSSRHLVYNQPTDSFWVWQTGWDKFRSPTCCGEFPSGDARGSYLAIGTESGYIGWFDRNLTSGVDGQSATGFKAVGLTVNNTTAATNKIVSEILLGPVLNPTLAQVMLRDVRIELTMDEVIEETAFNSPVQRLSGPFAEILAGQTAEEAIGENVTAVEVTYDPDYPAVTLDGGTPTTNYGGSPTIYDCGGPSSVFTHSVDLFYETEIAPQRYVTSDTLITDPTDRTYSYGKNRIDNLGTPPLNNWVIQHTNGSPMTMMQRDPTATNTSTDTPGGTYLYYSDAVAGGLPLPADLTKPRVRVSSGTYGNTNLIDLGELLPGRNDALRCRVRDQAAYVRIRSLGVPWAMERMSVLVDGVSHTKNVKGTY